MDLAVVEWQYWSKHKIFILLSCDQYNLVFSDSKVHKCFITLLLKGITEHCEINFYIYILQQNMYVIHLFIACIYIYYQRTKDRNPLVNCLHCFIETQNSLEQTGSIVLLTLLYLDIMPTGENPENLYDVIFQKKAGLSTDCNISIHRYYTKTWYCIFENSVFVLSYKQQRNRPVLRQS